MKITSYVIDPDGSGCFFPYTVLNLASDEKKSEDAKKELTNYIRDLEEKRGRPLTKARSSKCQGSSDCNPSQGIARIQS